MATVKHNYERKIPMKSLMEQYKDARLSGNKARIKRVEKKAIKEMRIGDDEQVFTIAQQLSVMLTNMLLARTGGL